VTKRACERDLRRDLRYAALTSLFATTYCHGQSLKHARCQHAQVAAEIARKSTQHKAKEILEAFATSAGRHRGGKKNWSDAPQNC